MDWLTTAIFKVPFLVSNATPDLFVYPPPARLTMCHDSLP